jgi:transposase
MDEIKSDGSGSRRVPVRKVPALRKVRLTSAQPELLPRSVEEMVDSNDPVRLVIMAIALLDLAELTKHLPKQGGVAYDPRILLGIWMFGLWDGERSSRRLEKRCRTDVRYMLLAGGLTPDHATLCRFRRFLGPALDSLLAQTVGLARDAGLAPMQRASLDGTRLPGAISQWGRLRKEAEEADQDSQEPPHLEPKAKAPWDGDARVQKLTSGGFIRGYNAQALVDCEAGVVLATEVSSIAGDASLLTPTLARCLDINADLPAEVLCDGAYDTPSNADALAESGIIGFIPCSDSKWVFSESPHGEPMCPSGIVALHPEHQMKKGVAIERLVVRACPGCSWQARCGGKSEKSLAYPARVDPMHWVRQRDRAKTEEARQARIQRSTSVELCFAFIKDHMKLRRLLLPGLAGAQIEFTMAAVALNLGILSRHLKATGLEALLQWLIGAYFQLLELSWEPYRAVRNLG